MDDQATDPTRATGLTCATWAGRLLRRGGSPAHPPTSAATIGPVWIVIGLAVGAALCIVGSGLHPEPRRHVMTDAAALGYRAGLGEDPTTMVMRRSGERTREGSTSVRRAGHHAE